MGEVFRYELEYRLRSPSTWIYLVILFLLSIQVFLGTADGSPGEYINTPIRLAGNSVIVGTFATVILAAIFGGAAVRDFQSGMEPLLFSSPLTKSEYLGGRFLASLVVAAVTYLAIPLGYIVASRLAASFENVGPFRLAAYLQGYVLITLPNVIVAGAILFTIGMLARQIIPVYLAAIGLIIGTIVALNYAPQISRPFLAAMADPSGIGAIQEVTRLWTEVEQNTRLLGFPAIILWNRIAWLAIATLISTLVLRRFRFAHLDGSAARRLGGLARPPERPDPSEAGGREGARRLDGSARTAPVEVPKVSGTFTSRTRVQQSLAVARTTLEDAIGRKAFAFALLLAFGLSLLWGWNVADTVFDASVWPVTHLVATTALGSRNVPIIFLLMAVYAGEMVWKERDVQVSEIADAAPVPEGVALIGRFLALVVVLFAIQCALLFAGIVIQNLQGYHNLELGIYLRILFGMHLAHYIIMAALAMTIHVLLNHKYLGHLAVLLAIASSTALPAMGLVHHNLLLYGRDPGWSYSDMNGFGPFLGPFLWFKAYWAAWALLLLVVARVMWIRGRETGLKHRFRLARARLVGLTARIAALAVVLILSLGGFIFYNTNVLNRHYTSQYQAQLPKAEYERRYQRFESVPQPTITTVDLRTEIYPGKRAAEIKGTYRLVNRTATRIDSLQLLLNRPVEARSISFDRPATPAIVDEETGFRNFILAQPLLPGDSLLLSFAVAFEARGFSNRRAPTEVVDNGTRFDRSWLPFVGYQRTFELRSNAERKPYDLPARQLLPSADDVAGRQTRNLVRGEDRVVLSMTVGTEEGQTVVGPGSLRREWTENGRRYFQYDSDGPSNFGATIYAGKYAVMEDRWSEASGKDVTLRIYHHPDHHYTLDRQMAAMKASLAYFTTQFGPYPADHLSIVEFPRYGGFGIAHRYLIGFAEDVFIGRIKDNRFDMPFYGTAHEVAHQWWGGMIRGGMTRGHGFTSESLANYCAMMVTETTLGVEAARNVFGFQMNQYLNGRANQAREVPLLDAEDQPYINYRKGAIAMYTLRELIGAERVNAALKRYFEANVAGVPPYPTSWDLYREFQAATPDSLQYVLKDWFENVTLWDVKTEQALVEPVGSAFRVTLQVAAKKMTADSVGNETEVPMNDLVEIGVFAAGDSSTAPLYLQRHRIRSGKQTITVTVPTKPARAGIDPGRRLIDRQGDDNVVAVRGVE
jgi:ABC-2 type transport system permease protein